MGKRFGRNQKRKLIGDLVAAERRVVIAERDAKSKVERLETQFNEFVSRCEMIDQRGYRITIDVDAIENEERRYVDMRTKLMNRGRDDLWHNYRVDPFRDIQQARFDFEEMLSRNIARQITAHIKRKGWI